MVQLRRRTRLHVGRRRRRRGPDRRHRGAADGPPGPLGQRLRRLPLARARRQGQPRRQRLRRRQCRPQRLHDRWRLRVLTATASRKRAGSAAAKAVRDDPLAASARLAVGLRAAVASVRRSRLRKPPQESHADPYRVRIVRARGRRRRAVVPRHQSEHRRRRAAVPLGARPDDQPRRVLHGHDGHQPDHDPGRELPELHAGRPADHGRVLHGERAVHDVRRQRGHGRQLDAARVGLVGDPVRSGRRERVLGLRRPTRAGHVRRRGRRAQRQQPVQQPRPADDLQRGSVGHRRRRQRAEFSNIIKMFIHYTISSKKYFFKWDNI